MTLPRAYFDDLYEADVDPWHFQVRRYEARKRALTIAALPETHYGVTFEPGCSIGVLTKTLAEHSDRVVAMDISSSALRTASSNVPANVELRQGAVPDDWPDGHFDLVVLSELGYYLDDATCHRLAAVATSAGGDLVVVHWRHPVADYPLTGDAVHAVFSAAAGAAGMARLVAHREDDFLLDVFSHDHRSVAARTGLVGG